MSKDSIVNEMIKFIEESEEKLQASKNANDSKTSKKDDIVNQILEELDKKVNDEN